jgi:hypothetical protein
VRGSVVTADLPGHCITRNAFFFERLNSDDYDDELLATSQNFEPAKQPTSVQLSSQSVSRNGLRRTVSKVINQPAERLPLV